MKNSIICNVTGDEWINSEQMVRVRSIHEVNQNPPTKFWLKISPSGSVLEYTMILQILKLSSNFSWRLVHYTALDLGTWRRTVTGCCEYFNDLRIPNKATNIPTICGDQWFFTDECLQGVGMLSSYDKPKQTVWKCHLIFANCNKWRWIQLSTYQGMASRYCRRRR